MIQRRRKTLPMRKTLSMKTFLASLGVLLVAFVMNSAQAKVYKWVNKDGSVSYSDTPQPGAEEIEVKEVPTVDLSSDKPLNQLIKQKPVVKQPTSKPPGPAVVSNYESAKIVSPQNNDTIQAGESGNFTVMVKTQPALLDGHKIQLMLNGKPYGRPSPKGFIALRNMYRGSHQIQAQIIGMNNSPLILTNSVTVHVKRAIVKRP